MEVRRAEAAGPLHIAQPVAPAHTAAAAPHPLTAVAPDRTGGVPAGSASAGAAAAGMGELAAKPAAQAGAEPAVDDAKQRELVTHQMEALKEKKAIIRPDQKGPEVVLIQHQLRQLGLHVKETGVMDKSTEAYIKAIQTGSGLGADGVVGPKTISELMTLDKVPHAAAPAPGTDPTKDNVDHMPDDPKLAAIYLFNRSRAANAKDDMSPDQERDMKQFIKNWDANKKRYEAVAETSGVPAKLIASLHWRESTGNFGTYLHQGDPLGKKAVHEPNDIPIFKTWEPAAEHALGMKNSIKGAYKIDKNTTDEVALASYSERYNGTGYFDYHAQASPYVMAGTDQYQKGKYRSDGGSGWDPNAKDQQLGTLTMMRHIDQHEKELAAAKAAAAKKAAEAAGQAPIPAPAPANPNQHFAQ